MRRKWNVYEKESVDPSQKKIFFIRHGESEAYINKAASHTREVHLTFHGKEQAKEIARRFKSAPDRIISSHYARALETARPTMERFADTPWEFLAAEEFTYLGSLDGVYCTMQERRSLVQNYWKQCNPRLRDGNGESFEMFIKRVRGVLNEIWKQPGSAVVFTHEQFMIAVQGLLEGWISDIPTEKEMLCFRETLLKKELSYPYGQILELPEHFDERKKKFVPIQATPVLQAVY